MTCPHKRKGRRIRTSDIYFIKRSLQSIELPLEYRKIDFKNIMRVKKSIGAISMQIEPEK